MFKDFRKLNSLLSRETRLNLPLILLAIILIGGLEMLSVMLLTSLLENLQGENLFASSAQGSRRFSFVYEIIHVFNVTSMKDLVYFLLVFMLVKHIIIVALNYYQFNTIFQNDIWLRNTLLGSYSDLNHRSYSELRSAELIRNTAEQVGQISYGALYSLLIIVSEIIVVISLMSVILLTVPLESTVLIVLVLLVGIIPFYIFKRKMVILGKSRFEAIGGMITQIQHLFGLFIEIKLYSIKEYFLEKINVYSKSYAHSQVQYTLLTVIPKGVIEISTVVVILILILNTQNDKDFLPVLGVIVASVFRIAPSMTRISSSLTQFKFSLEQINVLSSELKWSRENKELAVPCDAELTFKSTINVRKLGFRYNSEQDLIKNLSFKIERGDFVILKGKSGKGKSTIVKLLMGLLSPTEGVIEIDGLSLEKIKRNDWYKMIGYVPQKPTIIEGSLVDNICLGLEEDYINWENYKEVLQRSQLVEFNIEHERTILSNDGGTISGGQAQRISIGRALYREADVLFLDEPTSALDQVNSKEIHDLLRKLNKDLDYTIIVISHSNEFDDIASNIIQL